MNSGKGRGVAIYVKNGVKYTLQPLTSTDDCDALAIRTMDTSNCVIVVVYKPIATTTAAFCTALNNINTQTELLDTKYTVFLGDFNRNLMKENILTPLKQYKQVITEPTTAKGTLLDHIYIKPAPSHNTASVLTTYYSYHDPVSISIKY